ncbi:MAG: RecX family transcriptional regulator [Desulfobacterales bacterium]|nr:RecX family transcriptional regulator [Desulfobacterales bacterium]
MTPEFSRAYTIALKYLGRRARSVREMAIYLKGKHICEEVTEKVLARLLDAGYLNDTEFARQFIESRTRTKPKSTYALKYELRQKGISSAISEPLLDKYNDEDLACRAAASKQGFWQHLDDETRRKKLMNHLRYRGFDHHTCLTAWAYFKHLDDTD